MGRCMDELLGDYLDASILSKGVKLCLRNKGAKTRRGCLRKNLISHS